jgi:hypothetical protein
MPLADGPLITPAAGKCVQAENGRPHRQTGTFTRARRLAPADGGAPVGLAITRAGVASAAARNARPAHSGAVTPPTCPYQICMDVASRWLNPGFNGDRLVGHAASREADVDEVIHPVELEGASPDSRSECRLIPRGQVSLGGGVSNGVTIPAELPRFRPRSARPPPRSWCG